MARKVDITPDVSLIRKAGEVNYKIPQALAELVDNAIDEGLPGKKVTIEVTLGQKAGEKYIVVQDDARGMTEERARKALVMAHSAKKPGKIGEFGLGMKTACANLGSSFEIITTTSDSDVAYRLVYDEAEFIKKGKWEIEMEEVPKTFKHGTRITVTALKINLYAGSKDTVLQKFSKLFKHFVASGEADIIINGEQVLPHVPDTLRDYDTNISFEVNGKVVRGWASLLKHGSPKGGYGFDLVRSNRVVTEHEKLGFHAQSALSRVVGELHLDDFLVVNNKTDFRRDTEEWETMVKILNEQFLVDLKRESRRLANPKKLAPKDQAEVEDYIDGVREALKTEILQQDLERRTLDADLAEEFTAGPLPFDLPVQDGSPEGAETDPGDGRPTGSRKRRPAPASVEEHRLKRLKTQLRNIAIEHQVARLGKDSLYKIWDIEGVGAKKKLTVTTNSDHPMFAATQEGFLLWVKHNIVEAVAEFVTESTGRTDAMLLVKSDILKHIARILLETLDEPTYVDVESEDSTG